MSTIDQIHCTNEKIFSHTRNTDVAVIDLMRGMSPSTIDKEFRTLSPEAGGHTHSERQLLSLFRALLFQLKTKREFELTQAHLGLALKVSTVSV